MIRLNCFFQAAEGRYAEALDAARLLVEASLKQHGCIAYDVFESATREGILLICETWLDRKSLDDHSLSEPFVKYVGIINECGTLKLESFQF